MAVATYRVLDPVKLGLGDIAGILHLSRHSLERCKRTIESNLAGECSLNCNICNARLAKLSKRRAVALVHTLHITWHDQCGKKWPVRRA